MVLDEFQNLSLKHDSILFQILREGRKFNLYLLLATQTLAGFDNGQRAVLQQAATQLYFQPAVHEINMVSRLIIGMETEMAKKLLEKLQVGECLAVGRFMIGENSIDRPLKMSFR